MFYVYVLLSEKDGKFYIGQSSDLHSRISRHMNGYVLSTRNRRPLKLHYYEEYTTRSQAMKREKYLKSGEGHKFLKSIMVDAVPPFGPFPGY